MPPKPVSMSYFSDSLGEIKFRVSLTYLENFGIFKIHDTFLKVLVKDIRKTGFRSSLSQELDLLSKS